MALINLVKWQYFLNISRYRPSPVHNEQNETFLFVRAPVLSQPMLLTADINKNKTNKTKLPSKKGDFISEKTVATVGSLPNFCNRKPISDEATRFWHHKWGDKDETQP